MPLQRKLDAELERATGERDAAGSTAAKKVAEQAHQGPVANRSPKFTATTSP